ncbi:hypothetical protein GCM10010441_29140 [Kitasatospora paracochleata]|uniref:Uncharacterized protein n=1 Tax=Kitasatospora paracochleata TaxID=58354 RepID=A0ABT1J0T6_9ACTN|nr:hypothetical protein [Kitasatospora paracochleata]MCP2310391.1 hypothetical protein [Kitasatospora paracochleata]
MGDPLEPPEGTPEGGSGNEDEFRSVVFDESFVRAARIQELSARERLGNNYQRATRPKVGLGPIGTLPRQAVALLLLVVMAFAAAVYFGISSPHRQVSPPTGNQLTESLVALAPLTPVTAVADPKHPFAALPAGYAEGTAGLGTPPGSATTHFTRSEVNRALDTVQRYLVASAMAPTTLVQGETGEARALVTPGEQAQYDDSVTSPRDDQHHAATGWLVRFDPGQVALADSNVQAKGAIEVAEADSGTLEVTTDHTFVYALRPAGTTSDPSVTLQYVRRELRFELDRTDLGSARLRLVDAVTQTGPTSCGAQSAGYLQPTLATAAGVTPPVPPAVDPADHTAAAWQVCGVLGQPAR